MRAKLFLAAVAILSCGFSFVHCAEPIPDRDKIDVASLNAHQVWARVVESNTGWLQPSASHLSYVATCRPVSDSDEVPELISRVWVSGKKARCEFEGEVAGTTGGTMSCFVVLNGETEYSLNGPTAGSLRKPSFTRDITAMTQGSQVTSAVHVLARDGLPDGAAIIERRAVAGGHILVLEADLGRSRRKVGIGLYHVFYGSDGGSIGRVRVHIKTPEFVPVIEEYPNGKLPPSPRHPDGLEYAARDFGMEFGPEFMTIGGQMFPRSIRYSNVKHDQVLAFNFQLVGDHWVLDSADNTLGGRRKSEMVISAVSTDPVDPLLFGSSDDR